MLREYSHTNSESFAEIHTIFAEIQFFSIGLFFYVACVDRPRPEDHPADSGQEVGGVEWSSS